MIEFAKYIRDIQIVAIQLFAEYNFWWKYEYLNIMEDLKSQFNYSRNITFDSFENTNILKLWVAIQLFAEYNFW